MSLSDVSLCEAVQYCIHVAYRTTSLPFKQLKTMRGSGFIICCELVHWQFV
jgi:hypothetical protein